MTSRALLLSVLLPLTACTTQHAVQPAKPGMVARARCAIDNALGSHCRDQKVHPGLVSAAANWSTAASKHAGEAAMHAEATRTGRPVPKAGLEVLAYRTGAEYRGGEIVVDADILLFGRTPAAPEVVQAMTLVAANGEVASITPQVDRIAVVDGAGHYHTVSRYPLPPGTQAGVYTVRTALMIAGETVASRESHLSVRP